MDELNKEQTKSPEIPEEKTTYKPEAVEDIAKSEAEKNLKKILDPRKINLIDEIENALKKIHEYLEIDGAPNTAFFHSVLKEKERLEKLLELRKKEKAQMAEIRRNLDEMFGTQSN